MENIMRFNNQCQGSLDSLCGIYAIVNAFYVCGFLDHDNLFKYACNSLAPLRWPRVLWEGTTFEDLRKTISYCKRRLCVYDIEVSYPFWSNQPKTNKEYWGLFDEFFSEGGACCAIIGVVEPEPHWIVCGNDGNHIQILDSDYDKPFSRKRKSSLFAGKRRPDRNLWKIERRELIIFKTS
jgi:hypothetical protein